MENIRKTWNFIWNRYFEILKSLNLIEKFFLSILFSFLTGISAQLYIKLPFTPVPLTFQTFTVLLSGILLGPSFGCISQIIYLVFGLTKIPWFYSFSKGLMRPTTGYVIGFIFASFIAGYFAERKRKIIGMFLATLIIYFIGLLWLKFFTDENFKKLILIGVLPFIPFDLLKALAAGFFAELIRREKDEKI